MAPGWASPFCVGVMTTVGADCERALHHLHEGVDAQGTAAPARRLWRVQGLKGGARAYFVWRFLTQHPRPALLVLPSGKEAEAFADDLRFFFGEDETAPPFARRIHYFPAWDVAPFEDLSPTAETVAARIEGLYHLQQTKNPIVVTTAEALLQRVPPTRALRRAAALPGRRRRGRPRRAGARSSTTGATAACRWSRTAATSASAAASSTSSRRRIRSRCASSCSAT